MDCVVLVFNGVSTREVVVPFSSLSEVTDIEVHVTAVERTVYHGFEPLRSFTAERTLEDVESTDLLLIPGGLGSVHMMQDTQVIEWIRNQAARSAYVMSVSTGSLLLAAAGLLDHQDASGHWLAHDVLEQAGAHAVDERVTWHGKFITTSGPVAAAEAAALLPDRLASGVDED